MNKELEKGQYFFSDVKQEGILLYGDDECKLSDAKDLSKDKIREINKENFEQWFNKAKEFLKDAKPLFQPIQSIP